MPLHAQRNEVTASQLIVDRHLRQECRAESGEDHPFAGLGVVQLHEDARRRARVGEVPRRDGMKICARIAHHETGAGELLDRHASVRGERVGAPDHDGHGLVEERPRHQLRQCDELAHERDLDLVGAERLRDRVRTAAAHADFDVRVRARETRKGSRGDVQREVGRKAQGQHAPPPLASRFRLRDAAPHRFERGLGARQKATAGRGEADAPPAADQQLGAELALQTAQARGEGGLRELERRGSAGDAPPPLRLDKGLDLPQLHAQSIEEIYGSTSRTRLFYDQLPSVRCQGSRERRGDPLTHRITLIPGDGTGPEIVDATRRAIEATGVQIQWDVHDIGLPALQKLGDPFPKSALDSIRRNKVGLKGPLTTELGTGMRSVNVALRKEFDLYANLRPAKTYPGVQAPMGNIDLVVVRENIEDLYAGIEFDLGTPELARVRAVIEKEAHTRIREDAAIAIKYISVMGSTRIVKFAFDYAVANGRRKVTAVHKSNIMKFADGLFLRIAREVAQQYPNIEFEDRIVDNMCMQLVQKPDLYDVLVLPNLYGDIVSDLVAGLAGGLGVAPGANIGENGVAVFEAIHGSAPKYAGQNRVNPMALMLAGVLMLKHIAERDAADKLERAIASVVAEGKDVTYDLKRERDDPTAVGTREFADAVIRRMKG